MLMKNYQQQQAEMKKPQTEGMKNLSGRTIVRMSDLQNHGVLERSRDVRGAGPDTCTCIIHTKSLHRLIKLVQYITVRVLRV